MKHGMKVAVVTRRKGLFGTREVIRRKTIPVAGSGKEKWNRLVSSEAERLAALYRIWEEELAEEHGKERLE